MRNKFVLILVLFLLSCSKNNTYEMKYNKEDNIVNILRDDENNITLTIGLENNEKDSMVFGCSSSPLTKTYMQG
jgi:hypothetical protein